MNNFSLQIELWYTDLKIHVLFGAENTNTFEKVGLQKKLQL